MTDRDLLAFIGGSIRSVWALEMLLLLKRDPARRWTPSELVRELRASTMVVDEGIRTFAAAGLISGDDDRGWAYAPASSVIAEMCDALDRAYRERPVAVVNAIVSRTDKIQSFANAFRLRNEPK